MSERKIKESWRLLGIAQGILPTGNPVQKCRRVPRGAPRIVKYGNSYAYDNVVTCKSGWSCPICSPKKALVRSKEIRELHRIVDYESIMVTYTVQHNVRDRLGDLIKLLYASLRSARQGRRLSEFKKHSHGYIRSTEIMYGKNGWHPHIHEIIYVKKGSTAEHVKDTVIKHYKSSLAKSGRTVNDFTVDAKMWDGSTDYITKGSDIEEVVGWVNKESSTSLNIFQILRRSIDSKRFENLYLEYYYATKRRKITIVSRSLQEKYKEAKETVENEQEKHDAEIIHEFDRDEWKAICKAGIRYKVLLTLSGGSLDS